MEAPTEVTYRLRVMAGDLHSPSGFSELSTFLSSSIPWRSEAYNGLTRSGGIRANAKIFI
jgi:hypothetical protein